MTKQTEVAMDSLELASGLEFPLMSVNISNGFVGKQSGTTFQVSMLLTTPLLFSNKKLQFHEFHNQYK